MKALIWAEHRKLRRSKIVWIAVFAIVMVAVIVFAQGQFSFGEKRYIEGVGWFMTAAQSLATFFLLPAVIALLGSYLICREEQEDTMKSLHLIPINESKMMSAKMVVTLLLSLLLYLLLFLITFCVEAAFHFQELSVEMLLRFLKIYVLDGLGTFFALSPVIALVARIKKGYWLALIFAEIYSFAGLRVFYPITAVFIVSGYYEATTLQIIESTVMLLICGCISLIILKGLGEKKNIKR